MKIINGTNLSGVLWKYYLFVFLTSLHFFGSILVPFFTNIGGLSQAQIQLLQSWMMVWVFILEVPTGIVADIFGRRYSFMMGAAIAGVGFVVYGNSSTMSAFMLGEFIIAAGIALTSGADVAYIYDHLKDGNAEEKSGGIFGRAHSFKLFGYMISAILGSVIAAKFGLRMPMILTAIPFALAVVLGFFMKDPKSHSVQSEQTRYIDSVKSGLVYLYRHTELRALAVNGVLVATVAYFVIWLYQPLLVSMNYPIEMFGVVAGVLTLSQIIVSNAFDRMEKFFGSWRRFAFFSAIITGLMFVLTSIYPNVVMVYLFVAIAGGFGLTRIVFLYSKMNAFIESENRATVLSSINMFKSLALVFMNPVIGYMFDISVPTTLLGLAVLPFVAGLMLANRSRWQQLLSR